MKFGIREICDVVFRAKGVTKVGNRIFYKDEPIMYFDTLKTSSLEAASASVYAQGGRGNPRLVAWDGDRTLTFNMEDALISAEGLQILSGAGLMEAGTGSPIKVHATSRVSGKKVKVTTSGTPAKTKVEIILPDIPYWAKSATDKSSDGTTVTGKGITISKSWDSSAHKWTLSATYVASTYYYKRDNYIYVMALDEYGEVRTEPFIPDLSKGIIAVKWNEANQVWDELTSNLDQAEGYKITLYESDIDDILQTNTSAATYSDHFGNNGLTGRAPRFGDNVYDIFIGGDRDTVLVDYYVEKIMNTQQIEITADKFGGTYYIEGSTLFRTQQGIDMPAEFIIPNGKIQSNFTFSMAATGDPSTFTFTVDAMPDYTRFDKEKKVLAAIQIIEDGAVTDADRERTYTLADDISFN